MLFGGVTVVTPPAVTRFIFAGEAGRPGNTASRLADFSGNNRHLEQSYGPSQPAPVVDAWGKPTYRMNPAGAATSWVGPIASPGGSLTIYTAYNLTENTASQYLLDAAQGSQPHSFLLGTGNEELFYTIGGGGVQGANTPLPTGRHIFAWVIDTDAAKVWVYVDGNLFAGPFTFAGLVPCDTARLGGDYTFGSYSTIGDFYALEIARGIEAPAVRIAEIDSLFTRHFAGLPCPSVLRAGTHSQDNQAIRMASQPKLAIALKNPDGTFAGTNGATWVREVNTVYENGVAGYSLYGGDGYAFWFYGTGLTLRGARLGNGAPIAITVDGAAPVAGSCFGDRTVGLYAAPITGLALGYHYVEVTNTNAPNNNSQVNICNTVVITA